MAKYKRNTVKIFVKEFIFIAYDRSWGQIQFSFITISGSCHAPVPYGENPRRPVLLSTRLSGSG